MDEAISAEADRFVSFIERTEGPQFEPLRIAAHDGVAVAFYRRTDPTAQDEPTLLAMLLDEESPGQWEALSAGELAVGSYGISGRPSERGDWIVSIYGSAPPGANVAVVDYEGAERRARVESGVYAFMMRAATQPDSALPKPRFE